MSSYKNVYYLINMDLTYIMHGQKKDIPIVILAGGTGSRMGDIDKCLLSLGDTTILKRLVKALKQQSSNIILNANGDIGRFKLYGLSILTDNFSPPIGPLGGIAAALDLARSEGAQWCLSVAGDCPFIPTDLAHRLLLAIENQSEQQVDIVYCRSADRDHYTTALWSTTLSKQLADYIASGQRSVRHFIAQQHHKKVTFDTIPIDPFFNINTPEQWDHAKRLLAKISS